MKRHYPREDSPAPGGYTRHHHRTETAPKPTWNDWIGGANPAGKTKRPWGKIALVTLSLLALLGIMIGLIVELGLF